MRMDVGLAIPNPVPTSKPPLRPLHLHNTRLDLRTHQLQVPMPIGLTLRPPSCTRCFPPALVGACGGAPSSPSRSPARRWRPRRRQEDLVVGAPWRNAAAACTSTRRRGRRTRKGVKALAPGGRRDDGGAAVVAAVGSMMGCVAVVGRRRVSVVEHHVDVNLYFLASSSSSFSRSKSPKPGSGGGDSVL